MSAELFRLKDTVDPAATMRLQRVSREHCIELIDTLHKPEVGRLQARGYYFEPESKQFNTCMLWELRQFRIKQGGGEAENESTRLEENSNPRDIYGPRSMVSCPTVHGPRSHGSWMTDGT